MDQVLKNITPVERVMDIASLTNQGQPSDLVVASLHRRRLAELVRRSAVLGAPPDVPTSGARHARSDRRDADARRLDGTLASGARRSVGRRATDEQRNNSNFIVKGSSFLSTRSFGTHHMVFGLRLLQRQHLSERLRERQRLPHSGDHGRSSALTVSVFPQFLPNSTLIMYTPIAGVSEGSNLRMHSLFVNDTWRLNEQLSFNLGLRFDRNQAPRTAEAPSSRTQVHLAARGSRPCGIRLAMDAGPFIGQLCAIRDGADEQRRGVDDRGRQCGDLSLALPGAGHQCRIRARPLVDTATRRFSRCSTGSTPTAGRIEPYGRLVRAGLQHARCPTPLKSPYATNTRRRRAAARHARHAARGRRVSRLSRLLQPAHRPARPAR